MVGCRRCKEHEIGVRVVGLEGGKSERDWCGCSVLGGVYMGRMLGIVCQIIASVRSMLAFRRVRYVSERLMLSIGRSMLASGRSMLAIALSYSHITLPMISTV